jgi:hypothetical protein
LKILTTVEAAEQYGTSASSISRAASRAGVGVRRSDGRLLGLSTNDLKVLRKFLRFKAGNPTWVKKKNG